MFNWLDMNKVSSVVWFYDVMAPVVVLCISMFSIGLTYNLIRLIHVLTPTLAFVVEQLVSAIVSRLKRRNPPIRTRKGIAE